VRKFLWVGRGSIHHRPYQKRPVEGSVWPLPPGEPRIGGPKGTLVFCPTRWPQNFRNGLLFLFNFLRGGDYHALFRTRLPLYCAREREMVSSKKTGPPRGGRLTRQTIKKLI